MLTSIVRERSVCLAELYFEVLIEHLRNELAKPNEIRNITITYGELVRRAKEKYPNAQYIEAAIPRSIGECLLVIEMICKRLGLPNLACLAINAHGCPGKGYTRDWEADKAAVLAFDWNSVSADVGFEFRKEVEAANQREQKKMHRKLREPNVPILY